MHPKSTAVRFSFILVILCTTALLAQDEQLPCMDEPTDMTISVGDIINCSITPVADSDIFRFEGSAGHRIMLTLTDRSGGSPMPVARLIDPDGAPIDTLFNQDSGHRLIMELAKSGTYTILMSESGNNQTVSYNLALQSLFPHADEAENLCYDCVTSSAIDVVGDSDIHYFEGVAGETVILTMTDRTGGSPLAIAYVYGPDEELIDSVYDQDTGENWRMELPATGTYTVLIAESGDNQTASYNLALQRLFPRPSSAVCVEYGMTISESITPVADSDVFVFGGMPDTEIILTLTDRTGGSPMPVALLYDPDGELLETLHNQDSGFTWQDRLQKQGLYTVLMYESGMNQTASYNLGLQCLLPNPDACPTCSEVQVREASWGTVKALYR